jgi:membrane associated rhomboid family serine protease
VHGAVGLLLVLTAILSLSAAFGSRHGASLFDWLALEPARVLRGEVWRLITWTFVEPSPFHLLMGCLMLFWFASDLIEPWGSKGLFATYVGLAFLVGLVVCALGFADPDIKAYSYSGLWPMGASIAVAWGMYFPDREIRLFLIFRIRGIWLAWGTIVVTVVYAVYMGWEHYIPALVAMAAMLVWIFRRWLAKRWASYRRARTQARVRAEKRRANEATSALIKQLDALDDAPPPMPPELEQMLDRIVDQASRDEKASRAKNRR